MTQTPREIEDLVVRAGSGDARALEELFLRHAGLVAAVASAHLADPSELEDVVQETFLIACREFPRLRRPGSFGPWVSTIARNLARTVAERRSRARREAAVREEDDRLQAAARPEPPPRDELYRSALAEVERLPDNLREVFLLRYVDGRSCAEVAEELDVPVGTVTSRLSRGHRILRERMRRGKARP